LNTNWNIGPTIQENAPGPQEHDHCRDRRSEQRDVRRTAARRRRSPLNARL